jgi:hypothetical protein
MAGLDCACTLRQSRTCHTRRPALTLLFVWACAPLIACSPREDLPKRNSALDLYFAQNPYLLYTSTCADAALCVCVCSAYRLQPS